MMPAHILRKAFLFFLAIILTAFVFTACGGKDDADEDDEDTKKTEAKGREDLRKGKAAYEIGKYEEAAMNFALAAQDGNAEAMYLLGKCYQDGTGVERDIDKAEQWMKKAADRGYSGTKAARDRDAFPDRSIAAGDAAALGFSGGDRTISLPGGVKLELVRVEAGSFEMSARDGDNDSDEVAHRATLTKDFYIGQTEVTQAQWKAVMGTNPSNFKGDDLPVEEVSWNDAMLFCEKLNTTGKAPSGWNFTLPTETQWEYAARGGRNSKGYKYSGSDSIGEVAWYWDNADKKTHLVGQKKANELGLYDMSGNVCEWCLDDYQYKSDKATAEFSRGNDQGGSDRVIRGGSWLDNAWDCRSAYRYFSVPGYRNSYLGFRLALVPADGYGSGSGAARAVDTPRPDRSIAADAAVDIGFSGGDKTISLPGGVSMEMVRVEAGTFEMSARDGENESDEVSHRVTLTKDFWLAKTEVTQAQWKAVMGTNPSNFKGDDLPVEEVSWNDAMEFCEKLNDSGKAPRGWKFTLPTETQWEYAARGGKKSKGYKYSGSDNADEVAWYYENSGDSRLSDSSWGYDKLTSNHCKTHPVGKKKANELGLYDMSGNVWEWCLDDRKDKSDKATAEFTRGNDQGGSPRVRRGGSWYFDAWFCRSASRDYFDPGYRDRDLGFRVALVPVR